MKNIKVKIVNKSGNPLPSYETIDSAGMDVRACVNAPITILPMQQVLVPTGLYMELPSGYECQIRPRSGLALKKGISVLNSPGTIDADYRGEIGIILMNFSQEPFVVNNGDRICQMVIKEYVKANWEEVDDLEETERGAGGFGHTGV